MLGAAARTPRPTDGDERRRRGTLVEVDPRLVVASIVVALSILLALVVNVWRQETEREDRRSRARQAIRAELLHNHGEIKRVHPYRVRLCDTLSTLSAAGVDSADSGVRPRGMAGAIDDLSDWEIGFLREYAAALERLGVTVDALAWRG